LALTFRVRKGQAAATCQASVSLVKERPPLVNIYQIYRPSDESVYYTPDPAGGNGYQQQGIDLKLWSRSFEVEQGGNHACNVEVLRCATTYLGRNLIYLVNRETGCSAGWNPDGVIGFACRTAVAGISQRVRIWHLNRPDGGVIGYLHRFLEPQGWNYDGDSEFFSAQ
jgi:hypothetical protein